MFFRFLITENIVDLFLGKRKKKKTKSASDGAGGTTEDARELNVGWRKREER